MSDLIMAEIILLTVLEMVGGVLWLSGNVILDDKKKRSIFSRLFAGRH